VGGDKQNGGQRSGDALGLHLDAEKLNALLGRDVLASDVDVELHVNARGEAVTIVASARTRGGTLAIDGSVVVDPVMPAYDVKIDADAIETRKLLVDGATAVPPVEIGHATIHVKGRGVTKATAKADASIRIENVKARGVPIDAVAIDAHTDRGALTIDSVTVDTVGQRATVSGAIGLEDKTIDVSLAVDGDPGAALAKLRAAGLKVGALPPGAVVIRKGELVVHAKGRTDGPIAVDVTAPHIGVLGGRASVMAHAVVEKKDEATDGKKVEVRDLDATVTLANIDLSSIAELRGKHLPVDGTLSGRVNVRGAAAAPDAEFQFQLERVRAGVVPIDVKVDVSGRANARHAHVELAATQGGEHSAKVLTAVADLPLASKRIDPKGPLVVKVDVARRSFDELVSAAALPGYVRHKVPPGEVALAVDIHGTPSRPDGTVDIDVRGRFVGDKEQRVHLTGVLRGDSAARADLQADAWLDTTMPESMTAKIRATAADTGHIRDLSWNAEVDVRPTRLDSLPLPPERAARLRAVGGEARAHLALRGTLADLLGDARIETRELRPGGGGPVGATMAFSLREDDTSIDAGVDLAGSRLLSARGTAKVGGRGLLTKLREHAVMDPEIDVAVDVPRRPLSSLSSLRAALAAAPGFLEGHIDVSGTARTPLAKGRIAATEVGTIDGHSGGVALDIDASKDRVASVVAIGAKPSAIVVDAGVDRAALGRFGAGEPLPIEAAIRASGVDIRTVVPQALLGERASGLQGTLDADLEVHAEVAKKDGKTKISRGTVVGKLDFDHGIIPLPNTSRTYRDVTLHLESDEEAIRTLELAANESDLENAHRTLRVKGAIGLESLHATHAELDVRTDKWLLFGTKLIGQPDAPRGTLSLDAHVSGELEGALKKVDAQVKKLVVLFPDRFDKAHQPEDVHVGDVMFVGDPSVSVGKLPVPASVAAKAAAEKTAQAMPMETPDEEDEERGLDATIRIDGARVLQSPIDVSPRGSLSIRVRPSGRTIRGKLVMTKGELSLGGKMHALKEGSLVFDEQHPEGFMDLTFTRKVPPGAMPEVSEGSTGDAITIHTFGPIADRKTVLGGAGSPGTLYDLLAMHNAGHVRYQSAPGMPASNTTQLPGLDNVLALSFISVNLPHLLFLDRVGAWADAYETPKSYGRLEHYQAERYAADGKVLVRARNQPPKIGASQSELELDYLLQSSDQSRIGVGVAGGSRGGGGPGVFWEWASKE
jgi:hypothetical protein